MNDLPDDMDDNLRERLQNYSEEPDQDLFAKIDGNIRQKMSLQERLSYFQDDVDEVVWSNVQSQLVVNDFVRWLDWSGRVFATLSFLLLSYALYPEQIKSEQAITKSGTEIHNSKALVDNRAEVVAKEDGKLALSLEAEERSTNILNLTQSRTTVTEATHVNEDEEGRRSGRLITSQYNPKGNKKSSTIIVEANDNRIPIEDSGSTTAYLENETTDDEDSLKIEAEPSTVVKNPQVESSKDDARKEKRIRKPKGLYLLVMPTLGYQQISPLHDDNILIESIEKVSAFSPKRLGVRGEIGFEKALSKKLTLNVGVLYFQRKQTITYNYRNTEEFSVDQISSDSLSYQVNLRQQSATFNYDLKNVGVVAGLNYTFRTKRFEQRIGVGAELHRSLRKPDIENPATSTYLFGDVYYRLSYPVSQRFDLMFQPTLNYALRIHEQIDAPFYVKPYGLGLNFGAYYRF